MVKGRDFPECYEKTADPQELCANDDIKYLKNYTFRCLVTYMFQQ